MAGVVPAASGTADADWGGADAVGNDAGALAAMLNDVPTFNQNLGAWNTAKVVNMEYMFLGGASFNQPLDTWNTAHVTRFLYLYLYPYYSLSIDMISI